MKPLCGAKSSSEKERGPQLSMPPELELFSNAGDLFLACMWFVVSSVLCKDSLDGSEIWVVGVEVLGVAQPSCNVGRETCASIFVEGELGFDPNPARTTKLASKLCSLDPVARVDSNTRVLYVAK